MASSALKESEKELFLSIKDNKFENVKVLVNNSQININCIDENGMTPLQHVAYKGNFEMCKLLLERGADVNINRHSSGYTALMFAGLAGNIDIVNLLLQSGANTSIVNSVGRTAAQMAAFVGNHKVVSCINNFIPKDIIKYYTKPHGLNSEPKLTNDEAEELYQLILMVNVHPVKLALYLQEHHILLKNSKKIIDVLETLVKNEFQNADANEIHAFKFHHIALIIRVCSKYLEKQKEGSNLKPLIKSWLQGRKTDGFPLVLEKLMRQCIQEFPFVECTLMQQFVRTLASVDIGEEPSAIFLICQAIAGKTMSSDEDTCFTCSDPAEQQCSSCKAAKYCSQNCQKLHWFTHKSFCKNK